MLFLNNRNMKIIVIPNICEDMNHQNFLRGVSICHFYVFKSTHDSWERVENWMNIDNAFLILKKPTQTKEWNFWLSSASSVNASSDDMVTPKCRVELSLASGRSGRRIWNSVWGCSYYKWVNLGRNQWTYFFFLQPSVFLPFMIW